ncbi:predicted protein [Nematostella vectensis]|uniref:Uncharacterized protein n=1 Tax=Nematostella vectensis TaxID=45351 RepID=A7SIQ4_NEMVE|nr:predicted protein [Nematostella vectensis]|eukprot:XP_001628443.1 predicted protein [Nematostella vectensis]
MDRLHNIFLQNARNITEIEDFVQQNDDSDDNHPVEAALSDEDEAYEANNQLRCTNAAHLLRLKEAHNLSQVALDNIVQNTTTIVTDAVKCTCANIVNQMKNLEQRDNEGLQNIEWQTLYKENVQLAKPFEELSTEASQRQAFKELFGLVEPVKSVLGQYHGYRQNNGKRRRVQLSDEVVEVPFLESLEQWLNNPSILNQVENTHQRQDGMIADFCDGQVFKEHPLFSRDPHALQIILYYDEVEVVKTSKHKVGVFYYTLGNIDPKFCSQLKAIQLLAVAKRPVIQKYGCNEILRTFMMQIDEL